MRRKSSFYNIWWILIVLLLLIQEKTSAQDFPEIREEGLEQGSEIKSPAKAFFFSLLVPGLGEYYVGNHSPIKYFMGVETILWFLHTGVDRYSDILQDDYRNFASVYAGAPVAGKQKQYFINIGNFNDIYSYNNKKQVDRSPNRVYPVNEEYFWSWDTDGDRERFKKIRIQSDYLKSQLRYISAGIFVNHLVSAMNAAFMARRWNEKIELSYSYKPHAFSDSYNPQLSVTLTYRW